MRGTMTYVGVGGLALIGKQRLRWATQCKNDSRTDKNGFEHTSNFGFALHIGVRVCVDVCVWVSVCCVCERVRACVREMMMTMYVCVCVCVAVS